MAVTRDEFESWCFRNGGETYEEGGRPGVAYRFPDIDIADRIHYFPDNDTFDVITEGSFYVTRSFQQHTDSWIDEDDRLHIDTGDSRAIIDPR